MQTQLILIVLGAASAIALYAKRRALQNWTRRLKARVRAALVGVAVTLLAAWILISNADAVVQIAGNALVALLNVFGGAAAQNQSAMTGLAVGGAVAVIALAFFGGRWHQHQHHLRQQRLRQQQLRKRPHRRMVGAARKKAGDAMKKFIAQVKPNKATVK